MNAVKRIEQAQETLRSTRLGMTFLLFYAAGIVVLGFVFRTANWLVGVVGICASFALFVVLAPVVDRHARR
jgi:hypothetical protein